MVSWLLSGRKIPCVVTRFVRLFVKPDEVSLVFVFRTKRVVYTKESDGRDEGSGPGFRRKWRT